MIRVPSGRGMTCRQTSSASKFNLAIDGASGLDGLKNPFSPGNASVSKVGMDCGGWEEIVSENIMMLKE